MAQSLGQQLGHRKGADAACQKDDVEVGDVLRHNGCQQVRRLRLINKLIIIQYDPHRGIKRGIADKVHDFGQLCHVHGKSQVLKAAAQALVALFNQAGKPLPEIGNGTAAA